jgi:tRNA G18 (ribose-2'-O)-methylase SpoU
MQNNRKRTPDDIIIGVKPVEEALLAGKSLDKVLMQRGLQGDAVKQLRQHEVLLR